MHRLSAPDRRREELRALMNGDLGTAAGRSDLVRLVLQLIVEEALEGEVSDVLGRERYERGEGEKASYATRSAKKSEDGGRRGGLFGAASSRHARTVRLRHNRLSTVSAYETERVFT